METWRRAPAYKWYDFGVKRSKVTKCKKAIKWPASSFPLCLLLRTNFQVLVLVLGSQVLVLGPQSPQKLSRTLHSANSQLHDHVKL